MRISVWSSDVCSSDLLGLRNLRHPLGSLRQRRRLAAGCKHGFGHTAGITPGVCGAGAGAIRGPMKSRVAIIGLGSIGKLVLQELLDEASQDFQLALVQRTSKPPAPELTASVTRLATLEELLKWKPRSEERRVGKACGSTCKYRWE